MCVCYKCVKKNKKTIDTLLCKFVTKIDQNEGEVLRLDPDLWLREIAINISNTSFMLGLA